MGLSVQEFWQLVVASGLHDEENCRRLADGFAQARDSGAIARTVSLPEWMLASGEMTRYQARILLAGKPGPFVYGDYLVTDRVELPGVSGLFRAVHRPTSVRVTLWFLSGALTAPHVVAQVEHLAALSAEASRGCPQLTHCHQLIDLTTYKFLVIDELPERTLADQLAKTKSLNAKEAARVLCHVAQALAALHTVGQVHGAVRPNRIWQLDGGLARLASFPLARDPEAVTGVQVHLHVDPAAVDYCPPEDTTGDAPTTAGDIYSLGCVFYQLLAGRVPFPTGDVPQRLEQHRTNSPPSIEQLCPGTPKPLATLLDRMMARDPAARIADGQKLVAALAPVAKQLGIATVAVPPARVQLDNWLASRGELPTSPAPGTAAVFTPLDDDLASPPPAPRRASTRRSRLTLVIGGVAAVLALGGAAAYLLTSGMSAPQRPTPGTLVAASPQVTSSPSSAEVTSPDGANDADSSTTGADAAPIRSATESSGEQGAGAAETVVGLDTTMWASPTHGAPLELNHLVPGAEIIFALRPALLLVHAESEKLLDPRTLGPWADYLVKELPQLAGAPLAEIDRALIGVLDRDGAPQAAFVLTRREGASLESLLSAWGNPSAKEKDGVTYYQSGERAFYVPASEPAGSVIVVGPAELLVEEVIPAAGAAPAMSREMEALLALSDADRHLTVLASTSMLLTGGREWFPGAAERARAPLDWFLSGHEPEAAKSDEGTLRNVSGAGRSVDLSTHGLPQAVLASAHLTESDLFVELRIDTEPNRPAVVQAQAFGERMSRLPKRVSEYIRSLELSDYSHDVLFDFPLMIEQVGRYTVVGTDGRQVVLRAYLPSIAAHNMVLGTHLALIERQRSSSGTSKTAAAPAKAPAAAENVAQRLERKISLVFDRATLEKALQTVGDDIGVPISILGADLQAEGITKNQSFGMDERQQTAREILRKIMIRANPDGKLVYVIRPPSGGGAETLYITTRAAVRQRGEELPAEFAEQP